MPRAIMIPKKEWDKNKEHIRAFYLTQNRSLDDLISYMSQQHDFVASVLGERKSDGKETEIFIRGQIVPVEKLKKELARHAYDRYGPSALSKKSKAITLSEIIALTPSSPVDILVRGYTIPWVQFQDLWHSLVLRPTAQSASPIYSALLSKWQSNPSDLVSFVHHVVGMLWAASDDEESSARIMSVVQAQLPNRFSLDTITQCHESTYDSKLQVLEWLIYRVTNNIDNISAPCYFYDVLSLFFKSNIASKDIEKICSEGGSTFRILLSEILFGAVEIEDVPFIESLLELGAPPDAKRISRGRLWETALSIAAKLQNSKIVKLFLQRGADPNKYMKSSPPSAWRQTSSPVLALERPGGYEAVKQLVGAGAILNTQPRYSAETPLMLAAENGDVRSAKLLIERGSEINTASLYCRSALHRAIAGNNFDMVVLLLDNGADPNLRITSGDGPTLFSSISSDDSLLPLTLAAYHGSDIKIAQYLLDCGADIDGFMSSRVSGIQRLNHDTALQTSVKRCDFAMTELLLHEGASQSIRYATTLTALQQACELFSQDPRQRNIIDLLLESGADVNADPPVFSEEGTALQIATRSGNRDLITSLISHGGNIDSPSCLQVATSMDNISLVEFLLDIGSDANSQSHPDLCGGTRTALQTALSMGNTKLVGLLLSAGAVVNAEPSSSGMTDLQAALLSGDTDLVQMVIGSGANINESTHTYQETPLEIAASSGSIELVSLLIKSYVPINRQSLTAALELAVEKGYTPVAQLLIETGANIDIKAVESKLLYMAIESRCKESFDFIFAHGADPHISAQLSGLLVAAIDQRWLHAVDRLIGAGVDVNKSQVFGSDNESGKYNELPLHKAIASRQITLVERLLHAGADIKTRGLECVRIAIELQSADIVRLLLEHGVNPNHVFAGTSLTPLHLSLVVRHVDRLYLNVDIVRALIEHKADVNAYSSQVGYPLQIIWKRFFDHGWYFSYCKEDVLSPGARLWHQVKDLLLEAGADPVQLPSALQLAAREGDIERVRLLISNCEEVNQPAIEYKGATALQYAAMHGHFNIVALLLKNGADIHAPGAKVDGRTALQGAAENGRLDIVHLLLENDDEVDLIEERCCDAAEYAAREGHVVIAETLWAWSCMKTVCTMSNDGCGI
ncbi:hypothetical protein NW762_008904 [Fusarium torreyae]|uniref:Clr5 domain-containing protein n=1 Tax=Fusarium torreyae TaxID=1237075 RepID=A0A9W8RUT0_9HYPO|nr:hypothetical protein NW762_008904 [Fusarium torreyae]